MWRAPLRGFLLVLVVAGVAILSIGLWARYTVYDEDTFVEIVGGLSTDPTVQQVAIERSMLAIDREVEELTSTQGLAPTLTVTYQMLRPQIQSGLTSVLQSPRFAAIWMEGLRELHGPFTALLKGQDTANLKQTGNQVQLNLYPGYEQARVVIGQQNPQALALLDQLSLTEDDLWITVLEGDSLSEIQAYVRLFNQALAVGIIVAVLAAIGYVLLSSRKLRALAWVAAAVAVGVAIQRVAIEIGRRQLVETLEERNNQEAAKIFYDTLVADLRSFETYALVAAFVTGVVIYLVDRYVAHPRSQAQAAA